jgi:hypothetical protein
VPADVTLLPHKAPEASNPGVRLESPDATEAKPPETVLCVHCGRTARNGIRCQGFCVADSGY